ncbi:MAG: T9SS C-terminal target domain-containing protein [Bacteroidetes bacterium]|nr:MAG: T9SS C-terminal target domain-containing protein [Bacteroidota bacterium]
MQLHRRDYNVLPQIWPDGREGATAFSGVFQPTVDLPFLTAVNIDSSGYALAPNFTQYYNHYHCANVALYSQSTQEMHNVFFGGIAQFYDSLGVLVQDNTFEVDGATRRLSLAALPAGVYYLRMSSDTFIQTIPITKY